MVLSLISLCVAIAIWKLCVVYVEMLDLGLHGHSPSQTAKYLTKSSYCVILRLRLRAVVVLCANRLHSNQRHSDAWSVCPFFNMESIMQIRSSNSSVSSGVNPRNPIIIAFDRRWNELYRAPLSRIDCMAFGVREDYESGYRGIKINQAQSRTTHGIAYWSTPNI